MRFLTTTPPGKVAIIGLGYVGSCIAATFADRHVPVLGIDKDDRLIEELHDGECRFQEPGLAEPLVQAVGAGLLEVRTDFTGVETADVVLMTVGTPIRDDGALAEEQLRGACLELSEHLRAGQLIILKSTVPPGTTRDLVLPLLERGGLVGGRDFGLAFTPERLAEGTALEELRTLPIVVGGLEEESTRAAAQFWHGMLGVETIELESCEAAEVVKLADNWWIDLNIALANDLAKYCELYGADVLEVIAAANTITKGRGKVNILLPSVGVGGSCLTKDPWMVWRSAQQRGLDLQTAATGREVNDGMPEYTARRIVDELAALGKDPARATVAVLGLAFKNNTGDLRATPTVAAVKELSKVVAQVRLYDPLVDAEQVESMFEITPSASLREATSNAECVAVFALHDEFADIDFAELPTAESCLIFDGRAYYSREQIDGWREQGYAYRGIGR